MMVVPERDKIIMLEALRQARLAAEHDEVPVGAVIVHQGQIIARAHNQVEMLKDPTAHAEMIAITQATNALGSKWLLECSLYVTIEPCCMCAGAMVLARVKKLCYGASDPKAGACGSVENLVKHPRLNHRLLVHAGIEEENCSQLVREFFKRKRMVKPIR